MSIGQRKVLIRELSDKPGRVGQRSRIVWLHRERRQFVDEAEELNGATSIIAPKERAMAFGDHQGRGYQSGGPENSLLKIG